MSDWRTLAAASAVPLPPDADADILDQPLFPQRLAHHHQDMQPALHQPLQQQPLPLQRRSLPPRSLSLHSHIEQQQQPLDPVSPVSPVSPTTTTTNQIQQHLDPCPHLPIETSALLPPAPVSFLPQQQQQPHTPSQPLPAAHGPIHLQPHHHHLQHHHNPLHQSQSLHLHQPRDIPPTSSRVVTIPARVASAAAIPDRAASSSAIHRYSSSPPPTATPLPSSTPPSSMSSSHRVSHASSMIRSLTNYTSHVRSNARSRRTITATDITTSSSSIDNINSRRISSSSTSSFAINASADPPAIHSAVDIPTALSAAPSSKSSIASHLPPPNPDRISTESDRGPSSPSHHRGPPVIIPSRGASKKKVSIDDLLNAGAAAVTPPNCNAAEALRKWSEAITIAEKDADLFRKARAQSNIGCTLRSAGHTILARHYLEASLNSTIDYIKLAAARFPSNWLQIAIRALNLEGDQINEAFTTSSVPSHHHHHPSSVKSFNLDTHSTSILNVPSDPGAASIVNTQLDDASLCTPSAPATITTTANAPIPSTIPVQIDSPAAAPHPVNTGVINDKPHATHIPTTNTQNEPSSGSPIVVWLMQLTTNLGNVYFSNAQYDKAIHQHETCRRVVEIVLEEYPLPDELASLIRSASVADDGTISFATTSILSPLSPTVPTLSGDAARSTTATTPSSNRHTPNPNTTSPSPIRGKHVRLSFLHRQTLISQARSLMHLGVCFNALGLSAISLKYNMAAHTLVSVVASIVPSMSGSMGVPRMRSTSMTLPQNSLTDVLGLQVAVAANMGSAWHTAGEFNRAIQWNERSLNVFASVRSPNRRPAGQSLHRRNSSRDTQSDSNQLPQPDRHAFAPSTKTTDSNRQTSSAQATCSMEEARQRANIGLLYLDLASRLDDSDWLDRVKSAASATPTKLPHEQQPTETEPVVPKVLARFWPSLTHKTEPVRKVTEPLYDRSLGLLYEQATNFRKLRAWEDLFNTWIGIASAYLSFGYPSLALHYLAKFASIASQDATSESAASHTATDVSVDTMFSVCQPSVPERLRIPLLFTLAQTFFMLSRPSFLSPSSGSSLGSVPKDAAADNVNTTTTTTTTTDTNNSNSNNNALTTEILTMLVPTRTRKKITRLLSTDLGFTDMTTIDPITSAESIALALLTQCEVEVLLLMKMRALMGVMGVVTLMTGFTNPFTESTLSSSLPSSTTQTTESPQPHLDTVDGLKQVLTLVHVCVVKVAWVLVARPASDAQAYAHAEAVDMARDALRKVCSGVLMHADTAISGDGGRHGLFGTSQADTFTQGVALELLGMIGEHMDAQLEHRMAHGRSLVRGYLPPSIFTTIADCLSFAYFLVKQESGTMSTTESSTRVGCMSNAGRELLTVLGIPALTTPTILDALLNASITLRESGVGVCPSCLPRLMEGLRNGDKVSGQIPVITAQLTSPLSPIGTSRSSTSIKSMMNTMTSIPVQSSMSSGYKHRRTPSQPVMSSQTGTSQSVVKDVSVSSMRYSFCVLLRCHGVNGCLADVSAVSTHVVVPCVHLAGGS